MGGGDFDPAWGLAQAILGFTLIVGVFQLFNHGINGIRWVHKKVSGNTELTQDSNALLNSSDLEAENNSFFKSFTSYLIPFFRYLLATIYFFSVVGAVSDKYSIFAQPQIVELDYYLTRFTRLLSMQLLVICMVCLLWCYATQGMRRLIPWGLFIISVDVVSEVVFQYFQYPFYHWMQLVELLLTGLALLVIPATGFVVFKYLYKLQRV